VTTPIRLLISDIDGTLVRPDKSLAQPVVAAVHRLRAAGVQISLISARPLSGMLPIMKALGIEGPVGAFNGGTIAKPDGTVISAERLERTTTARALDLFDQAWVTPWLFADGRWFAKTTAAPHVPSERITAAQEPVIVSDFNGLLDRVDKLVAVSDDAERLAALEARTAAALGAHAAVARSQTYYLDVTAPQANKGAGVSAIAAAFQVPLANTAVIGDGGNDIRMFAVAGFSVAMANGSDPVRAAADATTASNADDGVAQAIDHLILPRMAAAT
jgi:Cof subfamily protein (haloacid dehalogenase superfamily)